MGIPWDAWFGTYRDKIGDSTTYKGEGTVSEEVSKEVAKGKNTQAELFGWPSKEQLWYNAAFLVSCVVVGAAVVGGVKGVPPQVIGALLAVGPVIMGFVLQWVNGKDKMSIRWPFQKEAVLGPFGFHFLVSFCFTVLPVYHTITTVMK